MASSKPVPPRWTDLLSLTSALSSRTSHLYMTLLSRAKQEPTGITHIYPLSIVMVSGTYNRMFHTAISEFTIDGYNYSGAFVVYDPNDPHKALYDVDNGTLITAQYFSFSRPHTCAPYRRYGHHLGRLVSRSCAYGRRCCVSAPCFLPLAWKN